MSLTQSLPLPSSPAIRLSTSTSTTISSTSAEKSSARSPDPNGPRYRAPYPLPVTPHGGLSPAPRTALTGPGESAQLGNGDSYYSNQNLSDEYGQSDVKDTQLVSPSYDLNQQYHHNGNGNANLNGGGGGGGASRYHHGSALSMSEDTTLSTFLRSTFLAARSSLLSALSSSPTSTSSQPLSLPPLQIPGASTIGFIILCFLWYLSSAFSSNTGKSILTRFRYPVTLTFVQFAFVAGYCVLFLALREQFSSTSSGHGHGHGHGGGGGGGGIGLRARRGSLGTTQGWGIRKPTKTMFHGTLMMSLFQIAGHVFSSMAIARVPVSTVHTIKALSPLFTVISYAALFRVRYSPATYAALAPLTLGVMLACSFDLRANAVGFLCALGSTVIFVSQNIFSKKLLPKESSSGVTLPNSSSGGGSSGGGGGGGKLDKLNLLLYSSGMAFVLMIPIWLYSDSSALLSSWLSSTPRPPTPSGTTSLTTFFFLNGTVHFAQNLLAFSILARTSPVTYSIASLIKRIAVICLAIVWSGQTVSFIQGMGMTMTFAGLWMYNRAKSDVDLGERKRVQAEKRQEMFLPTTLDDSRDLLGGGNTPPPPPLLSSSTTTSIHSTPLQYQHQLQHQHQHQGTKLNMSGVPTTQNVRSPTYAPAGFYGGAAASGGDAQGGQGVIGHGHEAGMARNRSTSTNSAAVPPPPPTQSNGPYR